MKILLCPDKFKGSLSAKKVCDALSKGLLSTDNNLNIISHPIADGGDGSVEILKSILKLDSQKVQTLDPLGRNIETRYHYSDEAAFIELASASGLVLLDDNERNPLWTSTLGTGLIMKDAFVRGFQKVYLFIGGSATNDGGIGIAKALGFDFLDSSGASLDPVGSNLEQIHKIENHTPYNLNKIKITVLCDVTNPMYGPHGAALTYAAQKGATSAEVIILDSGLKNYSDILKSQLNLDLNEYSGMGAAGAVGASLVGLLQAQLENGFQMLSDITHLEDAIKNADLVITGEGKIDKTSFQGKVVGNVSTICKKYNTPCGIVGGVVEDVKSIETKFKFQKSILPLANNLDEAMTASEDFLYQIGRNIGMNELGTNFQKKN